MASEPQDIGWRLQIARKMAQIGMEESAERLEISVESLREIESGRAPDVWLLRKMCSLYRPSEPLGFRCSSDEWPPPGGVYLIDDHLVERVMNASTKQDLAPLMSLEKPIVSFWACTPPCGLRVGTRDEVGRLAATLAMKVQQIAPEYLEGFARSVEGAAVSRGFRVGSQSGLGGGANVALSPRRKIQRWNKILKFTAAALTLISSFSAGALWQWDGKWDSNLTTEQATLIVQDPRYSGNEQRLALTALRRGIGGALDAISVAARSDDDTTQIHAQTALERIHAQGEVLLADLERR